MDDNQARNRVLLIGVARLAGAVLIVLGMLVLTGTMDLAPLAGWVLLIVGLADFAIVPLALARRWRTPKP